LTRYAAILDPRSFSNSTKVYEREIGEVEGARKGIVKRQKDRVTRNASFCITLKIEE